MLSDINNSPATNKLDQPTFQSHAAPREIGETFLILFDFDETITHGDSDELVSIQLGRGEAFAKIKPLYNTSQIQWTNAMSEMIGRFTREEIGEAIGKCLHIPDETIEALRLLHQLSQGPNPRVEYGIASDANVCFIDEAFKRIIKVPTPPIYSNQFVDLRETPEGTQVDDEGNTIYSKLTWHLPDSHNCTRCKNAPNMCKSVVVQSALNNTKLRDPTVIFCGDGFNDSCPMQKILRLRDHMFARRGFRLEKILMDETESKGVCRHHTWFSGEDLHKLIKHVVGGGSNQKLLPPIVLMGHEGGHSSEFRTNYLQNMMQGIIGRAMSEFQAKQHHGDSRDYSELLATLKQLCVDVSCVAPDTFADKNNIVHKKEFLPIPNFLLQYGNSWADLPWLHGCNYLQTLLWAIVYRLGNPKDASTLLSLASSTMKTNNAAATNNNTNNTPSAVDDDIEGSLMSVEALRGYAIPNRIFMEPIAPQTLANELASGYDMFESEKTSVTETFFQTHIRPMVSQVDAFLKSFCGEEGKHADFVGCANEVRAELLRLLSACVWGNTVDLALYKESELSAMGKDNTSPHAGHNADHTVLDKKVVVNNMGAAADYLLSRMQHYSNASSQTSSSSHGPATIDIIMDNMGVECAADMLLGAVLVSLSPALKVRYHTKPVPYYVSDVMPADIERMLCYWDKDSATARVSAGFRAALAKGSIEVHTHPYWVHPSEYRDMPASVVSKYFFSKRFGTATATCRSVAKHETKGFGTVDEIIVPKTDLVICKGEINYRRVCGDRHWTPEMFFHKSRPAGHVFTDAAVPFTDVVQGYWPSTVVPVLSLRTHKSELCVGPTLEAIRALDEATGKAWRCTGEYGAANFAQ